MFFPINCLFSSIYTTVGDKLIMASRISWIHPVRAAQVLFGIAVFALIIYGSQPLSCTTDNGNVVTNQWQS